MNEVRIGLIGCGGMGRSHLAAIKDLDRVRLTAASDNFEANRNIVRDEYDVPVFEDGHDLIKSGEVDAVLIATPHYFHPVYTIAALDAGLHALSEKPVSVTAGAAQDMNDAAARHPDLKFAVMFQMRTNPMWRKMRELITTGVLGDIRRIHWTATNWFRTQAYYNSGGWRATWAGEGGGVLLNQCPHNIDLLYWLCGLPKRITAAVSLGKYHDIEVEDDVTAILEYENGATGVFIAATGESPGTSFFEIVGSKGKATLAAGGNQRIELTTVIDGDIDTFCRTTDSRWGSPPFMQSQIDVGAGGSHKVIHENFVNAILDGEALIAPGIEGIHSVEMANAMIYAGLRNTPVDLPMDRDAYDVLLKELIDEAAKAKK